jgi:asparagine synthase (glutamine-hydrolysing)
MQRRGPDASSYWQSSDGRVSLFHTRLSIVDESASAHQPFSERKRGLTIAFNGEIYNYADLRSQLTGYPFRTNSDTEVLLAVFAEWGVEGFTRLRGMFACVLIDERAQRVFLVRDPVGKKPLYLARWRSEVLFGSSALGLVQSAKCPGALREDLALPYWEHGYIPPHESLLKGCQPLMPGEVLILDWEGKLSGRASCQPKVSPAMARSFPEACVQVNELLTRSVVHRLHNNPNPVCLLSGGVDSTIVALEMRKLGVGSAITLGSLIPLGQDEKYARYAAWRLGTPLTVLPMKRRRIEEDVHWALDLQDEPLGMISFLPLALLIRTAKSYGKVLLTGDGGDETFLGYGRAAQWTDRSQGAERYPLAEQQIEVGMAPPEWMSPWGKCTIGHALLGHHFPKLDRASAEQGVELRCPLLDWDLLSYARSLGPDVLLHGDCVKALLKAQLRAWPRWFVHRRKLGFAYRLRWSWALRRYHGLRELIAPEALEAFRAVLPKPLCCPPSQWRTWSIFKYFREAWMVLAWSCFLRRLHQAQAANPRRSAAQPLVDNKQAGHDLSVTRILA